MTGIGSSTDSPLCPGVKFPPSESSPNPWFGNLTTAELAGARRHDARPASPRRERGLVSDQVWRVLRSHRPDRLLMLTAGQKSRIGGAGNPLTAGDVAGDRVAAESGRTRPRFRMSDWVNPGAVATAKHRLAKRIVAAARNSWGRGQLGRTVGGNGTRTENGRFLPQQLGHELWQHFGKSVRCGEPSVFIQVGHRPTDGFRSRIDTS